MSCKSCQHILVGFMSSHAPADCPLMASAFCTHCGIYGHFSESCADPVHPIYSEQIPKIPSRIQDSVATLCKPATGPIEVQDNNTAIRTFLIENGMIPSGKIKENYRLVHRWASLSGKKVVYINTYN